MSTTEPWTRYRTYIASVGMWDIDTGTTHAVLAGRTLCGRDVGFGGTGWERTPGAVITCKLCRRKVTP